MEPNGGPNGEQRAANKCVDTLVLTYDRIADKLEVGGKCNSVDVMLDMLNRATRITEAKWRLERLAEFQQQAAEQARTLEILNRVRDGR